ncbi:MAG: thioesterase, partial [Gammaproteobacteria bacterium]|nr:thioesterase [Gammaproteobacteria bacterium]
MSDSQILERTQRFLSFLRHCQVLGLTIEHANSRGLTLRLPYSEKIIGNPETGGVHGGAITTL